MDHSCWVQDACRVCGGRLGRYKVSYDCHTEPHKAKLQAIGVSVEEDSKNIHPKRFCHGCYNICTRAVCASHAGKDYTPHLTRFEWREHVDDGCVVCQHFRKSTRGRKQKKASAGRPSAHLVELITSIKDQAPPSLNLDFTLRERLSQHPSTDEDLKCPICHLLLDSPVMLTACNTLVCLTCCVGHLYTHTDLSCPCCGEAHTIDSSTVIPASPVILKLLKGIKLPCERCQHPVTAGIVKYVCIVEMH